MRRSGDWRWAAAAALAVLALAAAPLAAESGDEVKKITVKKVIRDCQGDGCEDQQQQVRKVVFIGDDGEVEVLAGDDHAWVGHGGLHHGGSGGFLGLAVTDLTVELRRHYGVPEEAGVLVAQLVADSAAALAGVQVGDILTAVNGEPVASGHELQHAIDRHEPGAAVTLELWRDGTLETASATLGERPARRRHARVLHCEGGDCPEIAHLGGFDCGGAGECEIEIECDEGGCECVVNGEAADCESLPGFVAPGG